MTVQVLFIQGASAGAHAADRLLADGLQRALGPAFRVHYPRLPDEQHPDNRCWKDAIAAALRDAAPAVLVAHSAGAAIVADMLAQRDASDAADLFARVRAVLLLAPPFVGEGGWSLPGFHFDALGPVASQGGPRLHLFQGSADRTVPPAHAELYARTFPRAVIHRLAGGDHQFGGFMLRVAKAVRALARA